MRYSNNPFSKITELIYQYPLAAKGLALLLALLGLLSCWRFGSDYDASKLQKTAAPQTAEEISSAFPLLAETAHDSETDPFNALEIDLADYSGGCLINAGGAYRLTGETKGSVTVNVKEDRVHLFLDNVSITSGSGPAICCENADGLVITLLPGTENRLADSVHYAADSETEACLYSACDLTLNGSGALRITSLYKDAIRSKDVLKVLGGDYTVKCKRTAFHGNDGLYIADGSFDVSTEKVGFKTANHGADGRGNLLVSGGSFTVVAGRYAFVSATADLYIYDCSISHRSVIGLSDCGGRTVISQECVN